jgi:hypothetical protein
MGQGLCGHCGREGTLDRVNSWITLDSTTRLEPNPPFAPDEIISDRRLQVWRCSVCGEPTLKQYYWIEPYSDPEDEWNADTLYPREHDVTDLPDRVAQNYSQMMQVLFQPQSFAVGAGRVLEAVCADLGIRHGRLRRRLEKLAADQKLPQRLADQAILVTEYRNIGGHDDDREVQADDVPLIRGFVDSLLEYLYWGPAKYERAAAVFEERKAKRNDPKATGA